MSQPLVRLFTHVLLGSRSALSATALWTSALAQPTTAPAQHPTPRSYHQTTRTLVFRNKQ
jgi:hypothetical protein